MTSVSPITLATTQAAQLPQEAVAPATVAAQATSTSVTSTTTNDVASPRLLSDPLSGVIITQYLGSGGDVTSQSPSAAVVAYLREGLTDQGFPRDGGTTA